MSSLNATSLPVGSSRRRKVSKSNPDSQDGRFFLREAARQGLLRLGWRNGLLLYSALHGPSKAKGLDSIGLKKPCRRSSMMMRAEGRLALVWLTAPLALLWP